MRFRALRGKNQWNQGVDSLPPEREVEMPFEISVRMAVLPLGGSYGSVQTRE